MPKLLARATTAEIQKHSDAYEKRNAEEAYSQKKVNEHQIKNIVEHLRLGAIESDKRRAKSDELKKILEERYKRTGSYEPEKEAPKSKPVPKSRKPASKKAIKEAQDKYIHAVEVEVPLKRKRGRPRKDAPKRELDYSILETVKHLKAGRGMKPAVIDNGVRRESTMPEYLKQF